jgi:serine/threonine protein kinase/Tol biopolymer transport system component
MALDTGQTLGPYQIEAPAGAGGMGEVYKAKDTRLDRTVAIKVLPARTAGNADLRSRFEREAKAISSLNHPHICTLLDVGHENGVDYLVMEYIEGETLSDRLKKGPLETKEAVAIATQIADALDKAHGQGLIHRDLKPANVMLTADGAKLLDFGLAKLQIAEGVVEGISATQTTPLTGAGTIVGTMQYMSPEQLEGSEADARSDIFAFGALLYEAITARPAFEGKSQASLIAAILEREPAPLSSIVPLSPPALDRLVRKCLEKNPDKRWQSARDLADELRWISQSGSQAGVPAPVARKRRSRERIAWISAVLLFILFATTAAYHFVNLPKPPATVRTDILAPDGNTFAMEMGGHIALSPDGSKIAFVTRDTTSGTWGLWVRALNSLVAVPLPNTGDSYYPFWSPDSKYIAFFAKGKLRKILAAGGPVLTICDAPTGRGGTWNKDDIIVFCPKWTDALYKVAAAGGVAEPVTVLDTTYQDFCHRWPFFLPDNDHFLFFARTVEDGGGEKDGICIGSLSGDPVKRLLYAKSNAIYDKGNILYMRESVLMAQPFDPGSLELTGDAVPIAEDVAYSKRFSRGIISVSETGNLVYQSGEIQSGSQLLIYNRNGDVIDSLDSPQLQMDLQLSPDDSKLAVDIRDPNNNNGAIWIHELNRKIKSRLTFEDDMGPIWTPDGNAIIYRGDKDTASIMLQKNIDGISTPDTLAVFTGEAWPSDISPDGKLLVVSVLGDDGIWSTWIAPVDGSQKPYRYNSSAFTEGWLEVSPDGRWMAYMSTESGDDQLYVATFPEFKGKWQVSTDNGDRPHWRADGKELFYLDRDDNIMAAAVDGSGPSFRIGKISTLFKIKAARPGNIYDVWGDGQRFVVNASRSTGSESNITLVQSWGNELAGK